MGLPELDRRSPGTREWGWRVRLLCSTVLFTLAVANPASGGAQPLHAGLGVALRSHPAVSDAPPGSSLTATRTLEAPAPGSMRAPWWAPLASVLIPGTGQAIMGQERGAAYLVAEGYLLIQAFGAQRDVSRGIREYQRIAADAARGKFGGSLPRGTWEYYESLERYDASGMYDRIPESSTIEPETDLQTFNGQSWRLARETFWSNADVPPAESSAEYQRALAFYSARAVRDEFRWSWRDAPLTKDQYQKEISSTNRSNKRKTNLLTAVGANHITSLIDAYINVRLRRYGGAGIGGVRVDGVDSHFGLLGHPSGNARVVGATVRLVPVGPRK